MAHKALIVTNTTPAALGQTSGFHRTEDFGKAQSMILEMLGGVIEENKVDISAIHSRPVTPLYKEDTLQIYSWGFVAGQRKILPDITGTIFGYDKLYKVGFYEPTHEGSVIISPEGIAVAEYFEQEKVLIFLYDATHFDSNFQDIEKLFKTVLEEFALCHYNKPGGVKLTKEELEEKRRIARAEAKKASVVRLLSKMVTQKVASLRQSVKNSDDMIVKLRSDLIMNIKTNELNRLSLVAYEGNEQEGFAKMQVEFDNIINIKGILGYDVDGSWLVYITDTLYFNVNSRRYLVGRFKIYVNVENSEVKFINQDEANKRKGYWGDKCHAPHVNQEGKGCLGNVSTTLVQLITQNEWCALAMMLVGYLESVNIEDPAGKTYPAWDEVDKEGKLIAKGGKRANKRCHMCDLELIPDKVTFIECPDCGEAFCKEHYVYIAKLGRNVCKSCYENNYKKCSKCGRLQPIEYLHTCDDCGKTDICYNCYEEDTDEDGDGTGIYRCNVCVEPVPEVTATPAVGTPVCPHCGGAYDPTHAMFCEHCGTEGCGNCITRGTLPNGNTGYACTEHRS